MEMEKDMPLDSALKNALLDLEKAETLLLHWTNEYLFKEAPNPKLIFSERLPLSEPEKIQALKWFNEYRFISRFVQMALDYVSHGKQELEKAIPTPGKPFSVEVREPL